MPLLVAATLLTASAPGRVLLQPTSTSLVAGWLTSKRAGPAEALLRARQSPFALVVARSSKFVWPAKGPITSLMNESHPLGIDIGFEGLDDLRVFAAGAGRVKFAGGDPCCDYGIYVVIDHGDGFETWYGHLSEIEVSEGQEVAQGQQIGVGGDTGRATARHLHFEIRHGEDWLDPLTFLPSRQTTAAPASDRTDCERGELRMDQASSLRLGLTRAAGGFQIAGASLDGGQAAGPFRLQEDASGLTLQADPASTPQGGPLQATLQLSLRKGDKQTSLACKVEIEPSSAPVSDEAYY